MVNVLGVENIDYLDVISLFGYVIFATRMMSDLKLYLYEVKDYIKGKTVLNVSQIQAYGDDDTILEFEEFYIIIVSAIEDNYYAYTKYYLRMKELV